MSSACPLQRSALTSIRSMPLTTPPHCKANAAHDPTSPPPPMMLTFMRQAPIDLSSCFTLFVGSARRGLPGAVQSVHDLVGDGLDQGVDIGAAGVAVGRGLTRLLGLVF